MYGRRRQWAWLPSSRTATTDHISFESIILGERRWYGSKNFFCRFTTFEIRRRISSTSSSLTKDQLDSTLPTLTKRIYFTMPFRQSLPLEKTAKPNRELKWPLFEIQDPL